MLKQDLATLHVPPNEVVSFAPPPSADFNPMVDGQLQMLPLAGIIGVVARRFTFVERGGTSALKPGRPLVQSVPINRPPNSGFFVVLRGVNHAFIHNNPPNALSQRPLGQAIAVAGLNGNSLECHARLTDENMDDPIQIIVDVIVVFFN